MTPSDELRRIARRLHDDLDPLAARDACYDLARRLDQDGGDVAQMQRRLDRQRHVIRLYQRVDGGHAQLAGDGVDELVDMLWRYGTQWELGHEQPVWNDPDGGELRIVQALRRVLLETRDEHVVSIVRDTFTAPGANDNLAEQGAS